MTVPKELRFSHVYTKEAKAIAARRSHELSEPGKYYSMAKYINSLIEADGKANPDPSKRKSKK